MAVDFARFKTQKNLRIEGIKKDTQIRVSACASVLSSEDYQAYLSAQETLALACKKADEIVEDAKIWRKQEGERGYAEGFAQGKEECARDLIRATAMRRAATFEEEKELVRLALRVVSALLGEMDDEQKIGRLIRQALMELGEEQGTVKVLVHPTQYEPAQKWLGDVKNTKGSGVLFKLFQDDTVSYDTCKIQSQSGVVEGNLTRQLSTITQMLIKEVPMVESLERDA